VANFNQQGQKVGTQINLREKEKDGYLSVPKELPTAVMNVLYGMCVISGDDMELSEKNIKWIWKSILQAIEKVNND
jgi:hypothetical protein